MKALLLVYIGLSQAQDIHLSGRQIYSQRSQQYAYFSTSNIENKLKKINKTDPESLNEEIDFNLKSDGDPLEMSFSDSDLFCISNTLFAALFTALTFSAACSIVIAC